MTPVPRRKAGKSAPESVTPGATDTAAPRRQTPPPGDGTPPPPGGKKEATPPPSAAKPRSGPKPQLQKSLEELFSAPAYVYSITGDEWAENHVNESAPRLAEAWYKLAQKNPAVKRTLERLTTGSAWGGVAVATGVAVLPLLAHHELLPGPLGAMLSGVPGPTQGHTQARSPIVPPPPPPPAGPASGPVGGGGASPVVPPRGGNMTPPVGDGPPGVVTVQSVNRAVMVD